MPISGRPPRAPALHIVGRRPGDPAPFRLPLPPDWAGRPPAARAAERRARKAYFAALDALHLGEVNEDAVGRLQRLVADLGGAPATGPLEHLLRVFAFARSAPKPVLVAPAAPMEHVSVSVPAALWSEGGTSLAGRLAWPLEWLRMRRFVVAKGLLIQWHRLPGVIPRPLTPRRRAAHPRRRIAGSE